MKSVFFYIILIPTIAFSQEEINNLDNFSDTLLERKIEIPRTVKQLPTEDVAVLDTLINPHAILYKQYGIVSIAVKTNQSWQVWSLINSEPVSRDYVFERVQLDGKGEDELLIKTKENNGRSGMKSGWRTEKQYLDIWNLDTRELYASIQTLNGFHSWSTEYASDSINNIPLEKREIVKQDCTDKYDEVTVVLENKKIVLTHKTKQDAEKSFEYHYINGYFVRAKH